MKKLPFLLAGLLSILTSNVFACVAPRDTEYLALLAATGLEQAPLVQKLSATYCYDLNRFDFKRMDAEHPIFYAPNVSFLNYYVKQGPDITEYRNNRYNLDVFSKLLILPYTAYDEISIPEKEKVISLLKNYDPNANISWFKNDRQTIENPKSRYSKQEVWNNHQAMINYLIPIYGKLYNFPLDVHGNDVLYYSLITNEYNTFNALTQNYTNIYRRNKNGFTLYHLAFGKHIYAGDPKQGQENLKKINDLLVKNFKVSYIPYLSYKTTSFYHFIEMMKENNMDLYEKLKAIPGFKINPVVYKEDEKNLASYNELINYLKDLN